MATESKMDPQSYWSNWQQDHHAKYSIFQKDFIRDKLIKFTLSSFKQTSYFKYQQYMNQKDGRIDIGNQIKLWFLFRNNNQIIAKIKENLYEICYYRSGMEFGGGVYNFYGGLEHDKYLSQKIYKIGFETFKQQLKSNLRLQYKHEQSNLIFQQKIQISDKNWRYKSYLSYDIMNKLLKNCQFQIGNINIYGNAFYLRNRSKKQSNLTLKNLFSQIMVDYVHQASDKNLFGVQGVYNWDKGRMVFGSVWQHRFNEQKGRNVDCLKIKGDFDRNINITLNKSIENFGHYIYGLKICDFGRSNKLTYGISLNIHF